MIETDTYRQPKNYPTPKEQLESNLKIVLDCYRERTGIEIIKIEIKNNNIIIKERVK